jgi:hypothetical protein
MQLDLGLKEQVRAAAPKSAGTAKKQFPSVGYWQKRKRLVITYDRAFLPDFPIASIGAEHHHNAYSLLECSRCSAV